MFDILIVAAGNGTRMGENSLPKILTPINGIPNIQHSIEKISKCKEIGKIFIITNKRNRDIISKEVDKMIPYYGHDLIDAIFIIEIESGRGDGHAILEGYKLIEKKHKLTEMIFIIWGDAYLTSNNIFVDCVTEYRKTPKRPMYVPVINEKNPYVTFIVDKEMNSIAADFSKRGENHLTGFHDQCVFLCDTKKIIGGLNALNSSYLKNGRYITESGELTFLYLIHYFYNINTLVKAFITDSPVLSFNTLSDVIELEKRLIESKDKL